MTQSADCLDRFGWLGAPARARLERFVETLLRWQSTHNLVASDSLGDIWHRHVADGLQLVPLRPAGCQRWLDLGSGGGFPGLVVALALADSDPVEMTLVESSRKKAAFLRAAAREAGGAVTVVAERIEAFRPAPPAPNVISARALASLDKLLALAAPFAGPETLMLFPKGRDFVCEVDEAAKSWAFDLVSYESDTDSEGRILAIRGVRPRATES